MDVQHISSLDAEQKIDSNLKKYNGEVTILVKFYRKINQETTINLLTDFGNFLGFPYLSFPNAVTLKTTTDQLGKIAALPFVEYIQKANIPQTFVDDNLAIQRATYLKGALGFNLSGNGVVVGVGDGGTIDGHLDLNNRIFNSKEINDNGQ